MQLILWLAFFAPMPTIDATATGYLACKVHVDEVFVALAVLDPLQAEAFQLGGRRAAAGIACLRSQS